MKRCSGDEKINGIIESIENGFRRYHEAQMVLLETDIPNVPPGQSCGMGDVGNQCYDWYMGNSALFCRDMPRIV